MVQARQAGFTYLGLIIFVFILGMVGAATLKIGSLLQRAHAEQELLEIGYQFSAALRTYAEATPRGQPPQPSSLQELLRDTRFPSPRRHLRRIFVDPVSGKAEWGLVRMGGEGGRIVGVHSLSQAAPLKLANFDGRFPGFENREHISDWTFMAEQQGAAAPQQPQPGSAPQTPRPRPAPEPDLEPPKHEPPVEAPEPEKPAEQEEQEEQAPQEPPGQSQDSGR